MGLQNLWATYQKDRPDREALRDIVIEHFDRMLAEMENEHESAQLRRSRTSGHPKGRSEAEEPSGA